MHEEEFPLVNVAFARKDGETALVQSLLCTSADGRHTSVRDSPNARTCGGDASCARRPFGDLVDDAGHPRRDGTRVLG